MDKGPSHDVENIVSTTECTGIAPAPVLSEDAAETYAALYCIHKPLTKNAKKRGDKRKQ